MEQDGLTHLCGCSKFSVEWAGLLISLINVINSKWEKDTKCCLCQAALAKSRVACHLCSTKSEHVPYMSHFYLLSKSLCTVAPDFLPLWAKFRKSSGRHSCQDTSDPSYNDRLARFICCRFQQTSWWTATSLAPRNAMLSSTLGFSRHSAKLSEVSAFASLLHHQFWSNFKWRGLDSAHMGWVQTVEPCLAWPCKKLCLSSTFYMQVFSWACCWALLISKFSNPFRFKKSCSRNMHDLFFVCTWVPCSKFSFLNL